MNHQPNPTFSNETNTLTFLGHAGFYLELPETIVVMDPWLSESGAFDAGWFQFPCNHHLADWLQSKLEHATKPVWLYLSHHHEDHTDIRFLNKLDLKKLTIITPFFRSDVLRKMLSALQTDRIIECKDEQEIPIPGGDITIYVEDSELNRDSAILVRSRNLAFLNQNDCKIFDRLPAISDQKGPITAYACQFSGATWHPTCYRYSPQQYAEISQKKTLGKFEAVTKAIQTLKPKIYLPSAGPVCFLDPEQFPINFQEHNLFPLFFRFRDHLRQYPDLETFCPDLMPGDCLDLDNSTFLEKMDDRLTAQNTHDWIRAYAQTKKDIFPELVKNHHIPIDDALFKLMEEVFAAKLHQMPEDVPISVPFYTSVLEASDRYLKIDFTACKLSWVEKIDSKPFYHMTAPAWQLARVLRREIIWESFSLSFRARLVREPDIYNTWLNGFLFQEIEDLPAFCAKLKQIQNRNETIEINTGSGNYRVSRYCPHQGADLVQASIKKDRYLICPRHHWAFDLQNNGRCPNHDAQIYVEVLN